MDPDKLKKFETLVRIGGKGMPRRKKKFVHATPAAKEKKLQSELKKLSMTPICDIEEVNIIKDDGSVIHINKPKAQASLAANTFAITGRGKKKEILEMLPGILSQEGPEGLNQLKPLASSVAAPKPLEVPKLVGNLDEASIQGARELTTEEKKDDKPENKPATNIKAADKEADNFQPSPLSYLFCCFVPPYSRLP